MAIPSEWEFKEVLDQLDKVDERTEHVLVNTVESSSCKYKPWSLREFLYRLKTYRNRWSLTYDSKLGEVNCCRHGWLCDSYDKLACDLCNTRLDLSFLQNIIDSKELSWELPQKVRDRIEKSLIDEHQDGCLYKHMSFPDNIYELEISTELLNVKRRIKSTSPCSVQLHFPEEMTQERLVKIAERFSYETYNDPSLSVIGIALTGWTEQLSGQLYECDYCHRRVGVWNLKQDDQLFDVIDQHKLNCPWKTSVMNSQLQGWQIILQLLTTETIFEQIDTKKDYSYWIDMASNILQEIR
ncbi:zinc finger C3HC-type containing RNA export factor Rsm1 [Schizosaccharomyces osmophilus]|uniref:Zinc finger C3HC-type containing RNA export factor Rsm1 n=1 Tax=Schizosaccharomyces osmophilus TaxID=2545709 RepID=A0AAE9WE48_9SCHI|nr:zinc finger C3HC-type containing RNA export factor Rsm1 [Schizosaccharomyces osmophilus]WBW74662.1 zinc finger C3HC-type containing RNA export factor Rsm1 [Schizosaccharomyces osmophilus]